MNPPRCKSRRRLNALSIARMMVAIQDNALTLHELVDLTGLTIITVRSYVLTLHREGGCHIAHWEQDSRGAYVTPAWKLGRRKDASKPASRSSAERSQVYRDRKYQQRLLAVMAGPAMEAVQ